MGQKTYKGYVEWEDVDPESGEKLINSFAVSDPWVSTILTKMTDLFSGGQLIELTIKRVGSE